MCYFLLKTSNYLSDIKVPHTLHHGCMAPAARSAEYAKYTSQGGGGGGLEPPSGNEARANMRFKQCK